MGLHGVAVAADPPLPRHRPPLPGNSTAAAVSAPAVSSTRAGDSGNGAVGAVRGGGALSASGDRLFDMMDRNGDNRLIWREVADDRRKRFGLLDGDGDGRLAAAEFVDRPGLVEGPAGDLIREQRVAQFSAADRNRDGNLDADEYVEAGRTIFAAMDGNGDGSVSPGEFAVKPVR